MGAGSAHRSRRRPGQWPGQTMASRAARHGRGPAPACAACPGWWLGQRAAPPRPPRLQKQGRPRGRPRWALAQRLPRPPDRPGR
eukprot:12683243-Alexandrium_andersonii.AAC.1